MVLTLLQGNLMNQFEAASRGDWLRLHDVMTIMNMNDVDGKGFTALHLSTVWGFGNVRCVEVCIKIGANVNAVDNAGSTPLHLAMHLNVAKVLRDAGALIDTKDVNGWTSLYRAIRFRRVDIVRLFLDQGAKLSNVHLDSEVPRIPDWVTAFIES
jgi:ankyrin repeat protein